MVAEDDSECEGLVGVAVRRCTWDVGELLGQEVLLVRVCEGVDRQEVLRGVCERVVCEKEVVE